MKEFTTAEQILEFAMESEQQAVDFYNGLAQRTRNEEMKSIFLSYAREEMSHKARLSKIMLEGQLQTESAKVSDLKIADYVAPVKVSDELDYRDALVLAMKREKAAFRLYNDLANRVEDASLKKVFQTLAQEEAKHKLRFELEYDEQVLREN